ncbi:PqqD family protein [Plantactinospora sp. KBS50]|uniref:PqqD family protein n=1 Tax=Plantactinospora sp. KBS50 TaxID=2024580 RepID=UPI000BAADE2A|nr:PqqD family protein [Plantactinospora sp. KBS50]ASW53567.1 hypothetical protein CIK06_04265 [Plantactinospora sp. KBS50]
MTTGTAFEVSDDVVWAGDDTVRLYNVNTGQFQSLNGSASQIWCLMAAGRDPGQIADELAAKLAGGDPLARAEILSDVHDFLGGMAAKEMVIPQRGQP